MANTPKYTHAIGTSICKLISLGVTMEAAAQSEGVCKQTLYNWRDKGLAGKPHYAQFAKSLEKAQAMAERTLTLNIIAMARRDWKAGAWWLERRRPEVYGDRSRIEHHLMGEVERVLDVAKDTLDAASYDTLLGALSKPSRGEP